MIKMIMETDPKNCRECAEGLGCCGCLDGWAWGDEKELGAAYALSRSIGEV